MPPEDELSDEVPLSDENEGAALTSSSDSSVDFASDGADVPITGEAPDDDPYAYQDYDGPTEDLASELADDAGDGASYGYEAAAETARFDRLADSDPGLLVENVTSPDESDKYRLVQTESSEDLTPFAEDAGAAPEEVAELSAEPRGDADEGADGYASHHPDMDGSSDEGGGYTGADEGGYTGADEQGPAPAQGFTVEEEAPVAADDDEAQAASAAPAERAGPATATQDESRPGQVRKSAIEEMFARAAELKRQKGR